MKRKLYVLTAVTGVAFTAGVALFGAGNGNKGIKGEANTVSTSHKIEITAKEVASCLSGASASSLKSGSFSHSQMTWQINNAYIDNGKICISGGSFYNDTLAGLPSDVPGALVGTGFTKIEFKDLVSDGPIKVTLMKDGSSTISSTTIEETTTAATKSVGLTATEKVARVKLEFTYYDDDLENDVAVDASFTSLTFHYSCGTSS